MLMMRSMSFALLALAVGACRQGGESDTSRDTGMGGMEEMRGGTTGLASTQLMTVMDAQIGTMRNATPDSMKAMLPMYRQMLANMIAQIDREMRDMNMTGDAAWNATLDSLRQDLRVMPDLSAQALRDLMPAHSLRVRRVIDTHRSMMGSMRH
jgi:hypothetical protein